MLFLDPKYINKGFGKALMEFAISELNADKVDVNEQTKQNGKNDAEYAHVICYPDSQCHLKNMALTFIPINNNLDLFVLRRAISKSTAIHQRCLIFLDIRINKDSFS